MNPYLLGIISLLPLTVISFSFTGCQNSLLVWALNDRHEMIRPDRINVFFMEDSFYCYDEVKITYFGCQFFQALKRLKCEIKYSYFGLYKIDLSRNKIEFNRFLI